MPQSAWQDVIDAGASRIVLVGQASAAFDSRDLPAELELLTRQGLADCDHASRHDGGQAAVGLLFIDLAQVHGRQLEQTLGQACRLFPRQLLLVVDNPPADWSGAPLFAFGFRQLSVLLGNSAVHEYRLHDYKSPPGWLNARFWANPQRFDELDILDDYGDETGEFEDEFEDDDELD